MTAYYNEIDPFAAEWLRELIKHGHIAPGDVDTRSIEDVTPDDLMGYKQCHFFAGIGVWSYALRQAGWPDDRQVWTGSCPCQPFSAAGKGNGFADERHLWPAFHHLISQCRPIVVFGEQVASKDGLAWLDLVQTDLEGTGYTCGAVDTCSAGFGAPHIRQRLYWVGDSAGSRRREEQQNTRGSDAGNGAGQTVLFAGSSCARGLADTNDSGRQLLSHAESTRICGKTTTKGEQMQQFGSDSPSICLQRPSPTNGFWGAADWLLCRDGKWRPVESGTFPLAYGVANRVGRLRGYGNAINAQQAQALIEAYMEHTSWLRR